MQTFTGRTDPNLYKLKLKQKTIGKLGTSCTKIDMKTNFGKLTLFNDGNKIELKFIVLDMMDLDYVFGIRNIKNMEKFGIMGILLEFVWI